MWSVIAKKCKVSTLLSENPGCVSLALPPVSQLFHKTEKTVSHENLPPENDFHNVDSGSPQNQEIVHCAVPACYEMDKLKPLVRQRKGQGAE